MVVSLLIIRCHSTASSNRWLLLGYGLHFLIRFFYLITMLLITRLNFVLSFFAAPILPGCAHIMNQSTIFQILIFAHWVMCFALDHTMLLCSLTWIYMPHYMPPERHLATCCDVRLPASNPTSLIRSYSQATKVRATSDTEVSSRDDN
ncbi:hypothetical protein BKA66DRAFT_319318 [Pyrenochaeta sp. MPI-SDFR-AT-0127]|nr:hypothetical protein BKA66DRAFT_319318 [Pyrenochaeta sp. MPI-SDFR-AT-0127]